MLDVPHLDHSLSRKTGKVFHGSYAMIYARSTQTLRQKGEGAAPIYR